MYEEYFGLKKKPFSIVPDPGYFFMSLGHKEALAHLLYGIGNEGGFVLLTGEVGTGKTTVCRRFLELVPDDVVVAFILNPKVTSEELLAMICDEFRIPVTDGGGSVKTLVARINDFLLDLHEKGRRAVLIVEEAQNLQPEVLEQVRLLTNLETKQRKLLQMIMIGQPELKEILLEPQLRQLSQRITARYHLGPLRKEEIAGYVDYRLSVSGLVRSRPFPARIMGKLYRLTGGVPRLINVVCDRAMLGAYVQGKEQIDGKTLGQAAREVLARKGDGFRKAALYGAVAAVCLIILAGAGAAYFSGKPLSLRGLLSSRIPGLDVLGKWSVATGATEAGPNGPGNATGKDAASASRHPSEILGAKEQAFAALFSEWHATYDANGGDPDTQARAQGLRLLADKGSIGDLRCLNKPAVLSFKDEEGREYFATLTFLKDDRASLIVGRETKSVSVREIGRSWTGGYSLLWREPPSYTKPLQKGQKGPMVAWLEERLAAVHGRPLSTAGRSQVYNDRMAAQVMRFQSLNGMKPDGVVGPRTVIGLGGEVAKGDPFLHDERGGL